MPRYYPRNSSCKRYFTFYIPNAFTPNNDGWNDYWTPQGMNVDPNNYNEYIYDRWGNLIFRPVNGMLQNIRRNHGMEPLIIKVVLVMLLWMFMCTKSI